MGYFTISLCQQIRSPTHHSQFHNCEKRFRRFVTDIFRSLRAFIQPPSQSHKTPKIGSQQRGTLRIINACFGPYGIQPTEPTMWTTGESQRNIEIYLIVVAIQYRVSFSLSFACLWASSFSSGRTGVYTIAGVLLGAPSLIRILAQQKEERSMGILLYVTLFHFTWILIRSSSLVRGRATLHVNYRCFLEQNTQLPPIQKY